MKNITGFILLVVLLLAAGVIRAEEPEVFTSGDYQYILLEDGTAEITRYSGEDTELVISDALDGIKVTSIGDYAFEECESLISVTIPDSVTSIGCNPFFCCKELTEIIVSIDHPSLETIDSVLFSRSDRRLVCYPCAFVEASYTIPIGTEIIGETAFVDCESLESIIIPDSVVSIEDYAFENCLSLTSITIPDSVTNIRANPFWGCEGLTDIVISAEHPSLATIDGVLLSRPDKRLVCYPCALTADSYTIPTGIQIIGDDAFYCCESLTSVTIPDTVVSIGDYAFQDCSYLTSIIIPDTVVNIGINPFENCRRLADFIVSVDHPYLATIDGVLFSKPDKRLVCYPCALTADSYTIPTGIQIIGDDAFYHCVFLASVSIPDSVTSIGDYAFQECINLSSITIPDSVTSIGDSAFEDCFSLTSIMIPDSVTSIGDYVFYGCNNLVSVMMSDNVTSIGAGVFIVYQDDEEIPNPTLTVTAPRNSFAVQYCKENGINYTYSDALDWLNN